MIPSRCKAKCHPSELAVLVTLSTSFGKWKALFFRKRLILLTNSQWRLSAFLNKLRMDAIVIPTKRPDYANRLQRELNAFFSRRMRGHFLTKINPLGTPFQKRVWKCLRNIRRGKTASYGEIAKQIHARKTARAVGMACAANPIPILIPCHRVVSKTGIGGFSLGLKLKQRLLGNEQD